MLDLGCGKGLSSIFLAKEYGVKVWAADLIKPTEDFARISQAGVEDPVYPTQADARSLPFAEAYFDAILCTDGYIYFGTDDLYLEYLHLQAARHPPLTRKVASQSNRFTCKRFYK